MDDARLLRKSVESDLNRLELQLLQGDPSLAFIRDVLKTTRIRDEPLPLEGCSLWLKEQIDSGALPRDPELLRTLLQQAATTCTVHPSTRPPAHPSIHLRTDACMYACARVHPPVHPSPDPRAHPHIHLC